MIFVREDDAVAAKMGDIGAENERAVVRRKARSDVAAQSSVKGRAGGWMQVLKSEGGPEKGSV